MSLLKNVLVPFFSAVVGGAAVVTAIHYSPGLKSKMITKGSVARAAHHIEEDFDTEEFIDHSLPWPAEVQDAIHDIDRREDDKFVYYDIKVDDVNSTLINTRIEDGYVNVSGSIEKKDQSDSAESVYRSSFNRTFPVPDNVDAAKMEMIPDQDKYVLKFPKLKA